MSQDGIKVMVQEGRQTSGYFDNILFAHKKRLIYN